MSKILLITNFFPPAIGGIENYYFNFCRLMEPSEIVVLTMPHPDSAAFDDSQKYKIIRTEFFSGNFPPRWRPLKKTINKIIAEEGIEEIVFGHFHPYCLLARKFNLPFVVFAHGTDVTQIKNSWWQKYALSTVYKNDLLKKIIANSKFISRELARLIGDSKKLETVYPGIDYAGLNQPAADFANRKKLLGLDENDIIMLSLGRVEKEKNFEAIIRLMPALLTRIPQLKYVIVGGGSDLANLETLAQSFSLKYNVIFTGAVPNDAVAKAFYYQLAHIFLTVSLKPEGFGISYLEAAAAKTAVIASKAGGSAEAVVDGKTGILVDPGQPAEIQQAIYKLALDRRLWEQMSSAGQARAREFDWASQIKKLIEILK